MKLAAATSMSDTNQNLTLESILSGLLILVSSLIYIDQTPCSRRTPSFTVTMPPNPSDDLHGSNLPLLLVSMLSDFQACWSCEQC